MQFRLTSFHKKSAFLDTAHSENSESGCLSYFIQFFVWFHIVCDRYASDHAHFTFLNLIWPLSLSWVFEIQTNGYTEKLSFVFILTKVAILLQRRRRRKMMMMINDDDDDYYGGSGGGGDAYCHAWFWWNFKMMIKKRVDCHTQLTHINMILYRTSSTIMNHECLHESHNFY